MAPLTSIFPIILIGLAVSLLVSWPSAWLANRLRLVDVPGQKAHKKHSNPTPMGAGIALAVSFVVNAAWIHWSGDNQMAGIILGGVVVFGFGLVGGRSGLR